MSTSRDDKPNHPSKGVPDRLKNWLRNAKGRGGSFFSRMKRVGVVGSVREKMRGPTRFEFDLKKVNLEKVGEHSKWIRWGLIVIGLLLAAEITSRMIGLFIRPGYNGAQKRAAAPPPLNTGGSGVSSEDPILKRNMFNVEGKIPEPFDQGLLDCRSQAKLSTQRLQLLATIVTNDENFSVALIQEEGNPQKYAVRKEMAFADQKFVVKKIDRKEICFLVTATGEFEYVRIPGDNESLGTNAALTGTAEGITPVSERDFQVKRNFLDQKLQNLDSILQTARAVNYFEPGTGKFRGFQVISIDTGSPFAQLGVRTGDILTKVNTIVFDNPLKGLEAFQALRNAPKIELEVLRGGEKVTISYAVK